MAEFSILRLDEVSRMVQFSASNLNKAVADRVFIRSTTEHGGARPIHRCALRVLGRA